MKEKRKEAINDRKRERRSEEKSYLFISESRHALLASVDTYEMKMKRRDDNKKWREQEKRESLLNCKEWDDFKCERWSVESSLAQRDASSAEENARLDSSRNDASLQSSACICEHTWWEHDTCESSLRSDDERNDSIRSSDHDDLTYVSIYWNMQR